MVMESYVASTELKSKLSEYLRRVESGQSFFVTVRGTPIAHIEPIQEEVPLREAIDYMNKVKKDAPRLSSKKLRLMRHEDQK